MRYGTCLRALLLATASTLLSLGLACQGATTDEGAGTGSDERETPATRDAGASTPDDAGLPSDEDAGPRRDGSLDTGADEDAATPEPEGVPIFVAQGHQGRTAVSCDDGRSWVSDTSLDDGARCFTDGLDCDHHPGAAKGVTHGAGWFFATFGWGEPGSVQRSRDGVTWEPVLEDTSFGGIAWGVDRIVAGARAVRVSADAGETWEEGGDTELRVWNVRRVGFAAHDGGRFVLIGGDGDERDVVLSSDGGDSWWHPTELPSECGAGVQGTGGIAYGDGTLLILGRDGWACRSTDGGERWTATRVADDIDGHLVWDGEAFRAWAGGQAWQSPDGESWTSESTEPADLRLGAVAVSDGGTFVAVNGGWQQWYEKQVFYRSEDGIRWKALPADAYRGGHPIRFLSFGRVASSPACAASDG